MKRPHANAGSPGEWVVGLLRKAFPPLSVRKDLRPLSHDEAVQMRSRLASLSGEDLPFYLPQILEDLVKTHTGCAGASQYAEAVILHLNVLVEGTDLRTISEQFGGQALEQTLTEEAYLRGELKDAYASFTIDQAFAIWKWLELASTWQDLKWNLDEVSAAICYWQHRATGTGERGQS